MSKLSLFLLIAALAFCTAYPSVDKDGDSSDSDSSSDEDPSWMPTMSKMKPIKPEDYKKNGVSSHQFSEVVVDGGKVVKNVQKSNVVISKDGTTQRYSSDNGDDGENGDKQ